MLSLLSRRAPRVAFVVRARWVAAAVLLAGAARAAAAQTIVSVPFTNGFIGTRGSSAGTANNVLTYATLGIARTFFIQSSSTSTFELQGNDIPGTLRIVRTDGTTLDMPASANWRNSGGTTYLIGILPRPASPITFTYGGGSIQITDGASPGGSSVGGYFAGYTGATLADGASTSGNAAQSQVLGSLNSYLSTVVSSRPAGPVTVSALTTSSTTPTLTGTATLATGEALSVVVNNAEYTTTSTPAVVRSGTSWSLALTSALAVGTYSVTATITNSDGFTLSDGTMNELTITAPATSVTLGGSLTANAKTYDGTTAATGTTSGLTLVGVTSGDQVTIASATLAFQSAAVGAGKTVTITGVTLGGADAARYTASLAGAPTATASITTRPLTITGVTASSKTYDGTTAATLSGTAAYAGLASGESFAVAGTPSASFATPGVGTGKGVTVTGYTAPNVNYAVSQPSGLTATITVLPLTIGGSFGASDRTYDGTTAATIATNALSLVGVVGSDVVSLSGVTAAFADAAVGSAKPVSLATASLAGADAANYGVSLAGAPTTTASITAAPTTTLTLGGTIAANDRVYDGTTAATGTTTGLTLVGVTSGDQVSIASVTLGFQSAAVGTGKPVSVVAVTLGGADAARYTASLAGAPTTTARITAKPLTLAGSFTASDKTYDGTTAASIATNALTLAGVVSGDAVSLGTVTATFADAAVGAGKLVSLGTATLTGSAAGNYTLGLGGAPTATASITAAAPRVLTIAGTFAVADKLFDGTTAATITTNALTLVGVQQGDVVTLTGVTARFADPSVGNGKLVTLATASLGGPAAGGYTLSLVGAPTTTATIEAGSPPSAPRTVAATPGDGSLAVTWTAPATIGCRAIASYVVEYSADAGRSWSGVPVAGASTSAVVPGLVNGLSYQVRVTASNACGWGPFSAVAGPVVVTGPIRDPGATRPATAAPGTVVATTNGVRQPLTTDVVQDTILRLTDGDFALRLRAADQPGAPLALDSTRTLVLETGGRATAEGNGFAANTHVALYLVGATGEPIALGTVAVSAAGTFTTTAPIPATLAAGNYTLQVSGIDRNGRARAVALGVEVAPPPPDLVLTATPDQPSPAVGDTITITLTVTNHGRGPAIDVVIPRAFHEPGFTIVRTTPLEGTYDVATQTWTIGRIDPEGRARMLLTVIVLPPTPAAPKP